MRQVNRRKFIKNISTYLLGLGFGHKMLEASMTSNQIPSKFISQYWHDLHAWHCRNFFDFDKYLTATEKEFINSCINKMKSPVLKVDHNFIYSMAGYSHRIKNNKINSSRCFYGCLPEKIQADALKVIKSRGLDISQLAAMENNIIGLGWDFEAEHFKIYLIHRNIDRIKDDDIMNLRDKHANGIPHHKTGLSSYSFKGQQLVEKKIYLGCKEQVPTPLKNTPFSSQLIFTNLMITSERGIVPQLDLRNFSSQNNLLNANGKLISQKYSDGWDSQIDTIAWQDQDNYTIYFPD